MRKRPVSILKRKQVQEHERRSLKKQKVSATRKEQPEQRKGQGGAAPPATRRRQGDAQRQQAPGLRPTSAVHAQAAYAVKRLLEADASKRGGASLKSLTLAPHITAKKVGSCGLGERFDCGLHPLPNTCDMCRQRTR